MARIPDYEASGRIDVGGSLGLPNTPAVPTLDTTARALAGVGQAVESFGASVAQMQARQQASSDDAWFSRARAQTAIDWQQRQIELEQAATAGGASTGYGGYIPGGTNEPATPGAAPYVDNVAKEFQEYREKVVKGAPSERAKASYEKWADGFGAERQQQAIVFEENAKGAKRSDDFNAAMLGHVQIVAADPTEYDRAWARVIDDFDSAKAWMTPEQEIEAIRKVKESLQLARAKRLVQLDPLKFQEEVGLASGPVSDTARKIEGLESGGDPNARPIDPKTGKPSSSAEGLGQFTDGTWVATVRRHKPELANLSDKELVALKTHPKLGREMLLRLTEDNASALAASGLQATEANLYLAHFAGVSGARLILGSPDDAPLEKVLGADAITANPFLRGQTVGWLKQWAAAKMAGTTPAPRQSFADNPYYSELTPDQVFSLAKDADSSVLAQHVATVNARDAVQKEKFNTLMVGLKDGQLGLTDVNQARKEGWLTDYDQIKKATDLIETRDKDAISLAKALALEADPAHQFNPFINDDKDAVDLLYKSRGGATSLSTGDENATGLLRSTVTRTGIIPGSAVDALRMGMISQKPGEMAHSFDVVDGLYRQDPGAVTRAFSEEELKRMQAYQALAPITPKDDLYARLNPNQDPQARKLRDELVEEGKELIKDVEMSEILGAIDGSMWRSDPGPPIDTLAQSELKLDYFNAVGESYAVHGNIDLAKQQATESLRRKWGTTEVGDTTRLMAYPPERFYMKVDDSYDWMAEDLAEFVESQVPGAVSWGVVSTPETETARNSGRPPYWIGVFDENGFYRVLKGDDGNPILAEFDYTGARIAAMNRFAAARQKALAPPTPAETEAAVPFKAIEDAITETLDEVLKPGTGPEFEEFSDPDNPMGRRFDR